MNFFDHITPQSAKDELAYALQRTYAENLNGLFSLKGRAVCVLKVVTHASCIVLKPLLYLVAKVVNSINLPVPDQLHEADKKDPDFDLEAAKAIKNNKELRKRVLTVDPLALIAAPIGQIIQLFKAALGILYPAFYFKNDELSPYIKELAETAKAVGNSPDLIKSLEKGSAIIHKSLSEFPNREYYYAQFLRDFKFICEKFKDPQITNARKQSLLAMLNPANKSGIRGCPGALGRILQQMCVSINVPEDPQNVIPWVVDQIKGEIINTMCMQASTPRKAGKQYPEWHSPVRELAHDPAHRGNTLILTIGDKVGLSAEVMERAKHDIVAEKMQGVLSQQQVDIVMEAFQEEYQKTELVKCTLEQINSQADGSPGLKPFRDHVIQVLSGKIEEQEPDLEPTTAAVKRYYLNGGEGKPGEVGFNNLNEKAIKDFAATLGDKNPF